MYKRLPYKWFPDCCHEGLLGILNSEMDFKKSLVTRDSVMAQRNYSQF